MDKSIKKVLIRMVAVPVLVLLVMLGLSQISIRVLANLSETSLRARELENTAQEILIQFLNMETGLRGYLASHNAHFLEPYWESYPKLKNLLPKLSALAKESPGHAKNIKSLEELVESWYTYSETVRTAVEKNPHTFLPPSLFLNESGKKLMDLVRKNVTELIREEESHYEQSALQAKMSVRWALYSTFALTILLGLISIFQLRRQILRLANEFSESLEATRKSKEDLHNLNEKLEDTVKERTSELTAANAELEAFCYSVSHDLRAPLRGIDGFSEALQDEYAQSLAPEALKYLHFIRQGVQRMGQLIDDLLTLSRLTRSEISVEEVDLASLAKEVESEVKAAHPKRTVEFTSLDSVIVKGDRSLLHAVMTNLLSNAWKFTQNTAQPKIEFGKMEKEGQDVFFVKDNGAGFDMAYSPKLFGAFQRLHSAKEYPGTGVGLATVRRILRRHGGEVWAEGKPGEGATFYFRLGI